MQNREIKFRACKPKAKKVYEPCTLDKFKESIFKDWGAGFIGFDDDAIFLQFTGRKTDHGGEVYEGDIVNATFKTPTGNHLVSGHIEMNDFMWCLMANDGEIYSINRLINLGIIGNIYEHPHLIESHADH